MIKIGSARRGLAAKVGIALAWWGLAATVAWAQEEAGHIQPPGIVDILLLPKIWVAAIFCAIGLTFLVKARVTRSLRIVWLAVAFLAFGVLGALPLGAFAKGMGLHPSPVCAMTRPFELQAAGRSIPVVFFTVMGVISALSIAGNKLFCGWVCPLGAIQELPQRIPVRKKLRNRLRITLPFGVTNTIRVAIFIAFVAAVFAASKNIYDYFNPFEFFHWGFELVGVVAIVVTMIAAVFVFRPFCYIACPIGLYTWLLEHLSLSRVRLDSDACNMCDACVKLTNCPSVRPILDGKRSRPDCHACGQCITTCPKGALKFR